MSRPITIAEYRQIIRDLLSVMPPPRCNDLHHAKKDRHDSQSACPVEKRMATIIANATRAIQ